MTSNESTHSTTNETSLLNILSSIINNSSITATTTTPNDAASKPTNNSIGDSESITSDDAAWVLTCAFLILTMQTGFAMLEGGCVSRKNVANIMIKNVCDVTIGGIAYWIFGYALTFGRPSNAFMGYGDFLFHEGDTRIMGSRYAHYFFHFSFASTATTIVSGAVSERMKLHAYMIFSFLNVISYAIPASWCWNKTGFLKGLGFYDFSGVCVVHLNGGTSALVATMMLGPRYKRFEHPEMFQMSSPSTALTGMFMLTWAWLGFNSGSTFGITNSLWKVSASVSVCTLNGAIGGGFCGLILSMLQFRGQVRVNCVISSILGGLVSVTGICGVTSTYEALLIGAIGGSIAIGTEWLLEHIRVDDPVGAIPVHLGAALWGTLAVGIFGRDNVLKHLSGIHSVVHGGSFYLLGINALGALLVMTWSALCTTGILFVIDKVIGIRMNSSDEALGADYVEHNIQKVKLCQRLETILVQIGEDRLCDAVSRLLDDASQIAKTTAMVGRHDLGTESRRQPGLTNGVTHEGRPQSKPTASVYPIQAMVDRGETSAGTVEGHKPIALESTKKRRGIKRRFRPLSTQPSTANHSSS